MWGAYFYKGLAPMGKISDKRLARNGWIYPEEVLIVLPVYSQADI
jgi:hypothetical protein